MSARFEIESMHGIRTQDWAKIWVGVHNGIDELFWLRTLYSCKSTSVEPAVSNHPKYNKYLVVVYKNRNTRGASSEKRSRHIYFMEDNLLHAISKLYHV